MRQVVLSNVYKQHSLGGCVCGWGVDGLEHDLGHLFMIGLRFRDPW